MPASPSTDLQFCGRQITASPLHVCGGSIVSRELGVTRIQCGRCRLGRPPLSKPNPSTEASAPSDDNARIYPCSDCGLLRSKNEGGTTFTVCDECWDKIYLRPGSAPAAQPIERCSCAESIRLRAALETMLRQVTACRANPVAIGNHDDVIVFLDTFENIARRALALEPEGAE